MAFESLTDKLTNVFKDEKQSNLRENQPEQEQKEQINLNEKEAYCGFTHR